MLRLERQASEMRGQLAETKSRRSTNITRRLPRAGR